jgi:hypothetical protein
MPVKKRVAKVKPYKITPEARAAFRDGRAADLHRLLHLGPWMPSPLDAVTPEPPSWARGDGTAWTAAWPDMHELRRELEAGR